MDIGTFSISLNVKDIEKSLEFYEKLTFKVVDGGHMNKDFPDGDTGRWRLLENGDIQIGLFENMFDKNMLTFNPKDVRAIQKQLKKEGVKLIKEADMTSSGPEHITMEDPDGNPIMFDQF